MYIKEWMNIQFVGWGHNLFYKLILTTIYLVFRYILVRYKIIESICQLQSFTCIPRLKPWVFLNSHKRFFRIFHDEKDYGIYDARKREFLPLVGKLSDSKVFYNTDFHHRYMSCATRTDIESLVNQEAMLQSKLQSK